jgi:Holliday junction resolvase
MKSPEGYEKDEICKYLDSIRAWYFRPYMAGYGKRGVPDIIACSRGMFIAIEVKRPGKKPTPVQELRGKQIRAAYGYWIAGTAAQVISALKARFRVPEIHA